MAVVPAFDEADVHRLRLIVHGKAEAARFRARARLVELAQRKEKAVELLRRELRQRVGLIFGVRIAIEMHAVLTALDSRVVPGCDVPRVEAIGVLHAAYRA